MAVYYKFKSAKDYDSIPIASHFISVANLKLTIIDKKNLRRGTDYDLVISNAQTNEEYVDEAMLIPKSTSVLVSRVPGLRRMPIVAQSDRPKLENQVEDVQLAESNITIADSSGFLDFEASEMDDEFGSCIYAPIPEVRPRKSSNPVQDSILLSKADEDNKIKALTENSGFDWQHQRTDGYGPGKGFGKGGQVGQGFGRGGFELRTPPQGYVCHRCKVPGHFIQHCPTNGDPNYDIKKLRPATGIPKSMLVPKLDGSIALPNGTVAVLKPNEAAFEKEMEGLSSTRSLVDLPPELHCPLCRKVMKDAVLSSKCCFGSFCDRCIRENIISKSMCVCGARDILADDLVPNLTLRDTINRILESPGNSSVGNAGSSLQFQDMESAHFPQPWNPSSTQSTVSIEGHTLTPDAKETPNLKENIDSSKPSDAPQQQVLQSQTLGEEKITEVPDISEATHGSDGTVIVKEPASQGSALPIVEEVQQKLAAVQAGNKKKKRKLPMPVNAAAMQSMGMQPDIDEGYIFPSAFNPFQPGTQPLLDGFMGPFGGNMGYHTFGNSIPPEFFGAQGFMMLSMLPPAQSRDLPNDRDYSREASSGANCLPMKSKPKPASAQRSPNAEHLEYYDYRGHDRKREDKRGSINHNDYNYGKDHHSHRTFDHSSRDLDSPRSNLKRKSGHYHEPNHHHHDYSRSMSSSRTKKPSNASPVVSDKKHRVNMYSTDFRVVERSKKPRVECV